MLLKTAIVELLGNSALQKVIDESSVRGWVTTYNREMERKRKAGEEVSAIPVLPVAKRGRPLLLGDTLDSEVKSYIRSVREGGGLVTTEITMAAARAIVRMYNPGLRGWPYKNNIRLGKIIIVSYEIWVGTILWNGTERNGTE